MLTDAVILFAVGAALTASGGVLLYLSNVTWLRVRRAALLEDTLRAGWGEWPIATEHEYWRESLRRIKGFAIDGRLVNDPTGLFARIEREAHDALAWMPQEATDHAD